MGIGLLGLGGCSLCFDCEDEEQYVREAEIYHPSTGTSSRTGAFQTARFDYSATLLSTGEVLIVGGLYASPHNIARGAELYDPTSGTFSTTDAAPPPSFYGTPTTLLPSGEVLFGVQGTYQPQTGRFISFPESNTEGGVLTATLLQTGKVLIVRALPGGTADLFDPETRSFLETGRLTTPRHGYTATLLPSGDVLIAGGSGTETYRSAEIYDPTTGTFRATGDLLETRANHRAFLLPTGRVLIVGGQQPNVFGSPPPELYDPETEIFSEGPRPSSGALCLGTLLLPTGLILTAGNEDSLDVFDPTTGECAHAGELLVPRMGGTFTLLQSGDVLITGGGNPNYNGAR
jgi:hypothetical protein